MPCRQGTGLVCPVALPAGFPSKLPTAMTTVITPGENPIFHLMMPHSNVAGSSHMKTFLAISTSFSWCSASSFAGFSRAAPSPTLLYPRQTLRSTTQKKMPGWHCMSTDRKSGV